MRNVVISIAAVLVIAGTNVAFADVTVSVNNVGSIFFHEITVLPGEGFSVDVNVNTDQEFWSLSAWLEASVSNVFYITGGLYHAPWNVVTSPIPLGGVDPDYRSSGRLSGTPGVSNIVGPGYYSFATLDLAVDASSPVGTYTLNTNPIDCTFHPMLPAFFGGVPGPDFTVHVVLEPATLSLLALGGLVLLRRNR